MARPISNAAQGQGVVVARPISDRSDKLITRTRIAPLFPFPSAGASRRFRAKSCSTCLDILRPWLSIHTIYDRCYRWQRHVRAAILTCESDPQTANATMPCGTSGVSKIMIVDVCRSGSRSETEAQQRGKRLL